MTFGRFGREENALVMITVGGGLVIQILKRTAQFERLENATLPTGALTLSGGSLTENKLKKLDVPKKTKLYVD